MRYSSDHKEATRKRLLDKAGNLIKQNGFSATGVDALVSAAGLTAGAFYSHFGSKSEMLEALTEQEVGRSLAMFTVDSDEALIKRIKTYLNFPHVENPGLGCALPSLTAEIARADEPVRETFERLALQIKDRLRGHLESDAQAWSVFAQAVGAVMLARAMNTQESRKALLDGVRQQTEEIIKSAKSE